MGLLSQFAPSTGEKSLRQALRRTSLFPAAAMALFLAGLILLSGGLIMREIIALQLETVNSLAREVDQYLLERGRTLQSMATMMPDLAPEQQTALLKRTQAVYPSFSTLYLLDSGGRVSAVVGSEMNLYGLDLSGEAFFYNIPPTDRPYFSAPFVSLATGRVTTTAAAPLFRDGKLFAILVGELDLSQLQRAILVTSQARNGSETFVVDQEGVLVAHPNDTWVQEQRNMADMSLVQRGLSGEDTYEVFYNRSAGGWYIGSVAAMESGWVIVSMQPVVVAARSLFLLLGGAVLAISIALYLVLRVEMRSFRQLASPILYLSEQADAISRGDPAPFDFERLGGYIEMNDLGRSIAHMVAALQDRTRSLEDSWKDYRVIINTVPEAIWYLDDKGRVMRANRAALEILGLKQDQAIGKTVYDFFPQDMADAFQKDTIEVIQSGQPRLGIVERYPDHNGVLRWSETDKLPYIDAGGKVKGAIVFSIDITERKRAEEELYAYRMHLEELVAARTAELNERVTQVEQLNKTLAGLLEELQAAQARTELAAQTIKEANQELEAFAYTVSHDLRGPLRHINAYSRLLAEAEGERLDPSSMELLQSILQSVSRMDQLIADLLAFSRTGRAEMSKQPVALSLVIDQARAELASQTDGRRLTWDVKALPVVIGDASLLRQVWVNLLSNAVKFSSPRQEAQIEIGELPGQEPGMAVLYVHDNGVGFDQAQADKLFGVFQRLHRADEFEGTGIGLANVKRIVQRHGGRVWAVSKPGEGATFYLTLPLA